MKEKVWHVLGPIIFLVILSVFWTIAYFITAYFFQKFNLLFSPFTTQLLTSILGFLLTFICFVIMGYMARKRGDGRKVFMSPVIDAMQQISQGNYNVHVPKLSGHENRDHPFDEIVDNLNKMAKDLGEMEEMRQQFVSNVSHEIQSPLTSIKGFAIALQSENISDEQRKHYLKIIEKESERLSNLSDNLLKLTALESTELLIDQGRYRLDEQIRNVVLANEPQWMAKELLINLQLAPIEIMAEQELLDQVWMNLLGNAIKFTPTGGTIELKAAEKEGQIHIAVSDTGIGIAKEAQAHLFERFYKEDQARSREEGGNGLGLSIVRKIINMHGGSISVESEERVGTTFHVYLSQNGTTLYLEE